VRVTSRKDQFGQSTDHSWVKFFRPALVALAQSDLTPAAMSLLLWLAGSVVHGNQVRGYSNMAVAGELGLAQSTTSEALRDLIAANLVRKLRVHGLVWVQVNPALVWVGDADSRARERGEWGAPFVRSV